MKTLMKSSVDSSDVPVDNYIGTSSELRPHAACADVPMIGIKVPMCARPCVCAHKIIRTIGTSEQANIHAGLHVPIPLKHRNIIGTGLLAGVVA